MSMTRPHVLLFLCDQMQYQRPGTIDPRAYTPHLDRLADEGSFFTHHYCANAQCVPSRASLQTGRYPHEVGVMINDGFHEHTGRLTGEQTTVGQVFRDAGYTTAYFGKTHFGTSLERLGYDQGIAHDSRPPFAAGDRAIVEDAQAFLATQDPARPLFLTVSLQQPHPPLALVGAFASRYPPDDLEVPPSYRQDDLVTKPPFQRAHAAGEHSYADADEATLLRELREYYTMISAVDRLFGVVRAAGEARGMWDGAIVAFTSHHGDSDGRPPHAPEGDATLRGTLPVPLVLRVPGQPLPRRVIDDLTVNVSLPGTLIEAAGLVSADFPGGSLFPALRRAAPPDDEMIFFEHYGAYWGLHPFRAARTREWKYVRYYGPDQAGELYDLRADPLELRNLAGSADTLPVQTALDRAAELWWSETGGREFASYESPAFKARGLG